MNKPRLLAGGMILMALLAAAGWQLLTSAAFISMLLPLLIFVALQRYFVRGLLAGSVKG
jgi:alpha-glucoside transport system permease protein